jgi:hypothetical protein
MTPVLENCVLRSNLDGRNFALRNFSRILPPPPPAVAINDPRLSDGRAITPGTVTDLSVAATAAIAQSKLNLNGSLPSAWLGIGANQAARGDLSERVANKGALNGYAALDSGGLIPPANVATGAGAGKVNTVALKMPAEFTVGGTNPVTASGSFSATWNNTPDKSWFGVNGMLTLGPSLVPSFLSGLLPTQLLPTLDASKFTSGTFTILRLPVAAGLGAAHAVGILPDPGAKGDPNDYLGRDMQWHAFKSYISLQPTVPNVHITFNSQKGALCSITISSPLAGSVLFYRVNGGVFLEVHSADSAGTASNSITLSLLAGDFIEAYASRAGYNNSAIATYTVTPLLAA